MKSKTKVFHTDDAKRQAAQFYAITGNINKTSELTNIPARTIADWRNGKRDADGVFLAHVEQVRSQRQEYFIAQYENAVEASLQLLSERLQDERTTARDAAWIAAVCTDKAAILSGRTARINTVQGVQELARMFARLSEDREGQTSPPALQEKSQ